MLKCFRVRGRRAIELEELGVSIPAVLRRAGLPRYIFEQTRILVSTSALFSLWRAAEAASSDPQIDLMGVEALTSQERNPPLEQDRQSQS